MGADDSTVDRIVQELLAGSLTKAERIKRLRTLVLSEGDVPDELFEKALKRLMERLTE